MFMVGEIPRIEFERWMKKGSICFFIQ